MAQKLLKTQMQMVRFPPVIISLLLFSLFLSGTVIAQKTWKEIISVEDLCESYPETVKNMFDDFNLEYLGLGKVKTAYYNGNMVDACNYLLAYYKNGDMPKEWRREQPLITDKTEARADTILKIVIVIQNVRGEVKHIRSLFYVRGGFWVVVDRIISDRLRQIDALWPWHPECIKFIKGQEEPEIQGWYSPEYNIFGPNIASLNSTDISGNTTIVWLLLPSEKRMPKIAAEIMSENENEVKIEITSKKQNWQLNIPYTDSKDAKLVMHLKPFKNQL
jgi:hypothetical protein